EQTANLLRMVARAEVGKNNELISKKISSLDHVVQVHVSEFMNLLPAMAGPDEAHLRDQNLGLIDGRIAIQAGRTRVACITQRWLARFAGYHGARKPEIANPLTRQAVIFFLQLETPVPNDIAERGNGMGSPERGDDQLARQLDLVSGRQPVELADHPAAVQTL